MKIDTDEKELAEGDLGKTSPRAAIGAVLPQNRRPKTVGRLDDTQRRSWTLKALAARRRFFKPASP